MVALNVNICISGFMVCIGAQCDILCDSLRNLGLKDGTCYPAGLKRAIQHHQTIFSFSKECNKFVSFIILSQFSASIIGMASVLFNLSMIRVTNMEFYMNVTALCAFLLETFMYCWFGNEVVVKSDLIHYAAFESNWIDQSKSTKRTLLIFIMNAKEPVRVSSFKLFFLTLDTFTKILKSTWSYYTILRQLNSAN